MLTGILIIIGPPPGIPQFTMIAAYYMAAFGFYASVWAPRFSILCTILRIAPSFWRTYLRLMGVAFGGMWLFLFIQLLVHCETDKSWKTTTGQCSLQRKIAIAQLITDILTDLALSLTPIRLLWRANLSKGERVRLITVFTSCLLTTLVSLVHAYCIWINKGLMEIYAAIWEASVSMIVACLTVLLGYASRVAKKYLPESMTRTVWASTAPSGFELANHNQPINVDISTTVWMNDDTTYNKTRVEEGEPSKTRFEEEAHGDHKPADKAFSRCAINSTDDRMY
ncbi:hypothetical protein BD626DRAFT_394245 [Schizophyllum amplum]|uniref:Rhodopsin domain-containing protein n=1 Tax=Schizophyllum amplum TaxID=97359 RepID=A0A550CT44_9AGAR|nr:hypothetical protein BD626DRAFT_394245 [Auriculariopsis ampla]